MQDKEDDIRAVAAEALLPIAPAVAAGDQSTLRSLKSRLWDILLVLEDLDLSTGMAYSRRSMSRHIISHHYRQILNQIRLCSQIPSFSTHE